MKTFIVVGAGIAGVSAAYHLSRRNQKVIIVDREEKGRATDAAAGIICPWLSQRRNKKWYQLAKNGAAYYPKLIESLLADGQTDTGYDQVGALSIHTDEKKLDAMVERALKRREYAPEIGAIEKLNAKQTKEKFPLLNDAYQSVYVSGAARVSGRALRQVLLNAAKTHGATFIKGNATPIRENNRITGVNVNQSTYHADTVIVTTGTWMNEFKASLPIPFQVTKQKAQIMHLKMPDIVTRNWPVVMPPNDQYMLTLADDRIIVGATHENNTDFNTNITAGGIQEILTKAFHIAPSLTFSTILETRAGFRPFTPGFLPVIGQLPHVEGMLIANGLGASGLTMGPYIGALLTSIALEEQPDIDINPYGVEAIEG